MNSIFTFDNFRFASYLRIVLFHTSTGLLLWFDHHYVSQSWKNVFTFLVGYIEVPVSALANKDKL